MSIRISDKNKMPAALSGFGSVNDKTIEVGVFSGESFSEDGVDMSVIVAVHEFGSPTNNIPERSYLRTGYDKNIDVIVNKFESFIPALADGEQAETLLDALGLELKGYVQRELVQLSAPPLKEETIKRKGSSNPLVDEGNLVESIDYKVK